MGNVSIKKRRFVPATLFICILLLASCQSPAYRPVDQSGGWGYRDVPVRPEYYQIGYTSKYTVNPTVSRYYATLRAAELAIDNNKSYFEIIQATPGETPQTWAAADLSSTRPGVADVTVMQTSNVSVSLNNADAVLLIHLLDAPGPTALNAVDLLREAHDKGIDFDAIVEARLSASPPSTQAH